MNNDDFSPYELWSKLYTQLHLALVEMKDDAGKSAIGVSFPEYRFNQEKAIGYLGTKLRLFDQSEVNLQQLDIKKWLNRLTDYVHISSIRAVPEKTGYVTYSRKQIKTNAERLARHRVKRGDIDFEEALKRYQNVITTTELPYVQLESLSSAEGSDRKRFKLFIAKTAIEKSETQVFSTYGLSSESTVPEF